MSAVITVRRRLRLRRPRLALSRRAVRLAILGFAAAALILTGGWLVLRDSSLVSVEHVTITGETGSDAGAIRLALESAALKMTTLDVQTGRLRAAVSRFPEVKGLRVSTDFPHRIVIHVIELLPVALVKSFGREVPVTGDGTLLPSVSTRTSLPVITLAEPPSGGHLQGAWALGAARLLAAAPPRLLPRLAGAMAVAGHGLVVQIRSGPSIYFGDATHPKAKWSAVVAVLANPSSAGATYIDVTDPARPVAGSASPTSATATGTASTLASGTASTSAGTGSTSTGTGSTSTGTASTAAGTASTAAGTASAYAGTASTTAAGTPSTTAGTVSMTASTSPTGG
jgi:cell division septal protein FtsQ